MDQCRMISMLGKNLLDTFDSAKPRFLNRGKKAPLSINPEHTPGFRPGVEWVDLFSPTEIRLPAKFDLRTPLSGHPLQGKLFELKLPTE